MKKTKTNKAYYDLMLWCLATNLTEEEIREATEKHNEFEYFEDYSNWLTNRFNGCKETDCKKCISNVTDKGKDKCLFIGGRNSPLCVIGNCPNFNLDKSIKKSLISKLRNYSNSNPCGSCKVIECDKKDNMTYIHYR